MPQMPSRRRVADGMGAVALLGLVALLVGCGWFRITGGHWERVETPSMGTAAPVGTLLWVRPVTADRLRVGDLVSFHQPDAPGAPGTGPVYSHRVTRVLADGSFETAGDLSGPDRWRVPPAELVGRAVWAWPGAGPLAQAAPLLLVGALVTAAAARRLRGERRLAAACLGASLTLTAAVVVYHPLVDAQFLGADRTTGATGASGLSARFVNTGMLPIRVGAPGARGVVLRPGQSDGIATPSTRSGPLRVQVRPAVPPWFWVLLVGLCLAPAAAGSLTGVRRAPPAPVSA